MNKKLKIKCSKCGRKDFMHLEGNHYWCGLCGAMTDLDGYQYIEPPRQSYICPRCGKWWDYADDEDHMCKNCHYKVMTKTEFSAEDYEKARRTSPEALRQFKQNLREKYTINSPQFNQEMYNELIQKEYKDYLERKAREKEEQMERAIRANISNVPKCPTCGSTNIEKISTASKITGGFLFGIFSSNVRNTYKCNNCGYKW